FPAPRRSRRRVCTHPTILRVGYSQVKYGLLILVISFDYGFEPPAALPRGGPLRTPRAAGAAHVGRGGVAGAGPAGPARPGHGPGRRGSRGRTGGRYLEPGQPPHVGRRPLGAHGWRVSAPL